MLKLDAQSLAAAGRNIPVPFDLTLSDGRVLTVERLLRVLPGKRVVGVANWQGNQVLVKCFVAARSEQHWQRETQGIELLLSAGVDTPQIVHVDGFLTGGHVLLTRFLPKARSLGDVWKMLSPLSADVQTVAVCLAPALQALASLHRAGLVQTDLHLDNFLLDEDGCCYVIDGDAVQRVKRDTLSREASLKNLAILFAQLAPNWDTSWPVFLAWYGAASLSLADDLRVLRRAVAKVRVWRLRDYLSKAVRDCSLFSVEKTARRFVSTPRDERSFFAAFLEAPDAWVAAGHIYKDGGACTVARVGYQERDLVIKRYNIKNWQHAISRCWRPTRAWHSWLAAHRLHFWGVATPQPLALIEERKGPLRGRAFFVTAYCPGASLHDCLEPDRLPEPAQQSAILRLFETLHRLRITHGDLKAHNLFWHAGEIVLIDLDALTQHRSDWTFRRAWASDRKRFLRNWPADSLLFCWLDAQLPVI